MGRRWVVVGAACAAIACGCSRPRDPGPVVDQDLQFRLGWPGPGWTMLSARNAGLMLPGATAGVSGPGSVLGGVLVDRTDATDLRAVAQQLARDNQALDKVVTEIELVPFAGQQAARWRITGKVNGQPVTFEYTVLLHRSHLYQLVAWSIRPGTGADGGGFRPFTDAFSLLDGPISPRADAVKVADAAGVGWRVRRGVFESAPHGLRAVPRRGWRVVVGADLARLHDAAEVGLSRSAPQAHIVIVAERAPAPRDRAAYRRGVERRAGGVGVAAGPPLETTIAGVPVGLREVVTTSALALRFVTTLFFHEDTAVQVMGWTSTAEGDAGRTALIEGLAAIELMSAAERVTLTRSLAAQGERQTLLGKGFSFRRDVYRDFERGLTFHRAGPWRLRAGDGVGEAPAFLYLEEPALGLRLVASTLESKDDPRQVHELAAVARLGQTAPALPAHVGKLPAHRSFVIADTEDGPQRSDVITVAAGRHHFVFHTWGHPDHLVAGAAALDDVLAAFRFDDAGLRGPAMTDGRRTDLRLGFSYRPPAAAWTFADVTPAEMEASTTTLSWTTASQEIFVGAFASVDTGDATAPHGMDLARARLQASLGSNFEHQPALVAGRRAERSRARKGLRRMEAYTFVRDGIGYVLIGSAPLLGHGDFFEALPAGFAFLD